MATNIIESVDTYPYALGSFGNSSKYVILESDYFLYFGKRKKPDGTYELFAKVTSRYYPHDVITNGEKTNITVYKIGELPTASWTLDTKNKTVYLFLSNTTSYLHDQPELPEDIKQNFDESEPDLTQGLILNSDNLYDVVSELPFFDPNRAYRQFAITKSGYNGKLYQKKTSGDSTPGVTQQDPFLDKVNWELYTTDGAGGGADVGANNYVDLTSTQGINGQKTFLGGIYKDNINNNPTATEVVNYKEVENIFMKKGDTAVNADRLTNFTASDIRRGDGQVVVVTNQKGKIDDSFLSASIVSTAKNLQVDPGKANGIDIFSTIQEAFEVASKMVRLANVTIQVTDGVYSKGENNPVLNFESSYDCSRISIIGNINNPERCIIRCANTQNGLLFTGKGLFFDGFKFELNDADKAESIAINIKAGANIIFGNAVIINGFKTGLSVTQNSYIDAGKIQATTCDTAFHIDASTANLNESKTESCYLSINAENNAVVYAKGAIYEKGNIQSTNTVGIKVAYGAIVRAEETVASTNTLDKPYNDEQTDTPNSTLGIIQFT